MPEDKEERKDSKEERGGLGEKGKERAGGLLGDGQGEEKKKKDTILWWGLGIGIAGLVVTVFLLGKGGNSGSSTTADQTPASSYDPYSTSGYANGYAQDYWPSPYDSSSSGTTGTVSTHGGGSSGSSSGSGSKSGSSGSKSGSSGSKSGSSGSKSGSSSGSKSGSSSGSKSGSKSGSSGSKSGSKSGSAPKPNPTAGGAHGYVYTAKAGDTLASLQQKFFPSSNGSNKQGNLMQYANNATLIKYYRSTGAINSKGQIKAGTKLNA